MTLHKIFSGASAIVRDQRNSDRRKLNLSIVGAGHQASIASAIADFREEENKTWNLQVNLFAIACLSIVYLAVCTFN
jgi:hypothetical protein